MYFFSSHPIIRFIILKKIFEILLLFAESAEWGTIKFFTDSSVSYEANSASIMTTHFVSTGQLRNTVDNRFRAIRDNRPSVAFVRQLTVGANVSDNVYYGLAHIRRPAISYTDGQLNQLWESYFNGSDSQLIDFFWNDREEALKRALSLDSKVLTDARKVGGDSYAKIVSAALRQVLIICTYF